MLEAPRATVREEAVGGGDGDEGRRGWGYVALAATRGGRRDDSGVVWNEIFILFPERKKKKKEKTKEKARKHGREVRDREKILARPPKQDDQKERATRVPLLTAPLLPLFYCRYRRNCLASSATLHSSLSLPLSLSLSLSPSLSLSLSLSLSFSLSFYLSLSFFLFLCRGWR